MRTCCWPRASNHHYVLTTRLRGGVFKALLIFHIHGSGGCSDKTFGGGEKNLRARIGEHVRHGRAGYAVPFAKQQKLLAFEFTHYQLLEIVGSL